MKIITISREFGSGGRELGKRLAEQLGFKYYDKEIITEIAKSTSLDEDYISNVLENGIVAYPTHIGRSFLNVSYFNHTPLNVLISQEKIIKTLAEKGDCVIIGRSADVILKEYNPLNIFVYAEEDYKLRRCRIKGEVEDDISDRALKRKIKKIDKGRFRTHRLLSDTKWGDRKSYHLMINTTNFQIKDLVPAIKEYAVKFFENK